MKSINSILESSLNPTPTVVQINNPVIRSFDIQLNDGVTETGRQAGTGVDSSTVSRNVVDVFRDDVLLREGVEDSRLTGKRKKVEVVTKVA